MLYIHGWILLGGGFRIACDKLGCLVMYKFTLKLLAMVLYVAQVVSALGNSLAETLSEPCQFFCSELRVLLTHMSNVELVIESISVPTESFSEDVLWGSLADEARYSEEACNACTNLLDK